MYPGTTQAESTTGHQYQDRHLNYPTSQSQKYPYTARPAPDLPRPLEPRPIHRLHSSLSEVNSAPRRYEDYRGLPIGSSEPRGQGQNLPGLRDILTPTPHGYHTTWTPTSGAPPRHVGNEGHRTHAVSHPPLALYPPPSRSPAYQHHPPSRLDLPILETSPVARQPPHSLPVSPYTCYPEPRGYPELSTERARQASTTSFHPNGVHSPYTSGAEDTSYRHAGPPYDRSTPNAGMSAASLESQGKYLGVKDLPGEGQFHLYEGGHRIPTHVDGEQVNPAWGLTKANKPRKRLALACLDCREKKIKCEPGVTSCLQCEKAKRPCRRAPLHQPSDGGGPPVWQHSNASSPVRKGTSDPTPQPSGETDSDSASKRRARESTTPPNVPLKKQRSASPPISGSAVYDARHPSAMTTDPSRTVVATPHSPGSNRRPVTLDDDPYTADPELTIQLLDFYFTHINEATYSLFPRNHFLYWAKSRPKASRQERLVLYAILAVGAIFADDHGSEMGKQYVQIATNAVDHGVGKPNMCTVQARFLLALYHLAIGDDDAAWDFVGRAVRESTSAQLRLNTEGDYEDDAESDDHHALDFGFTRRQQAECRRRTFWSIFMLDRFQDGLLCAIDPRDVFLRLPCSSEAYEHGLPSDTPFYNNGVVESAKTAPSLTLGTRGCPLAWLVLTAAIWGDVLVATNRTVYRGESDYRAAYEKVYSDTHAALQDWLSKLPDHLQYSEANVDRSIQGGYAGVFISMHAAYHFILIRLNRYVRHAVMPDIIARNIRAAHIHANSLLAMTSTLQAPRRDSASHTAVTPRPDLVLTTPFLGQAIVSAIDVVGAGGLDAALGSTVDAIDGGIGCLRELACFWTGARRQLKASEIRYYQIKNILARPYKARSGAWLGREWGVKDRMEQKFRLDHDCIYADDGRGDGYTRIYFDALQENGA